jgi:hypothetical protein
MPVRVPEGQGLSRAAIQLGRDGIQLELVGDKIDGGHHGCLETSSRVLSAPSRATPAAIRKAGRNPATSWPAVVLLSRQRLRYSRERLDPVDCFGRGLVFRARWWLFSTFFAAIAVVVTAKAAGPARATRMLYGGTVQLSGRLKETGSAEGIAAAAMGTISGTTLATVMTAGDGTLDPSQAVTPQAHTKYRLRHPATPFTPPAPVRRPRCWSACA